MITLVPQITTGTIAVPGSKSISNRALVLAALANHTTVLEGMLISDDTKVMMEALKKVGVKCEINETTITVHGCGGKFTPYTGELYFKNAGTATRFFTTLACLIEGDITITGNQRMQERPLKDLVEALQNNGQEISYEKNEGYPPITVKSNQLSGGNIIISGNTSSQYISSLLLAAPYSQKPTTIIIEGNLVSRPFLDITINMMKDWGIAISETQNSSGNIELHIPQKTYELQPTHKLQIEGDASSASYPLAMAAITGGTVTVSNLGSRSIQGDAKFYKLLEKMGCKVEQTETTTTVTGPRQLKAIEVDMDSMTDLFITVAILAAVANGTSKITNIANQRVKECDRIKAMYDELSKCGVQVTELEDGLIIEGGTAHGAKIECYDDHRIAMSFAVLGCVVEDIVITDPECTGKTWPEFWGDVEKICSVN
jgi:pentafunctional AROM polypeptide